MSEWESYLARNRDRFLGEFLHLLRIPSVSTDAASRDDLRRAADWMGIRLRQAGLQGVRVMETGGHPAVYGEWMGAPGRPTVLFYGHYDVQPVDPLDLWTNLPFEPKVTEGRVYARGASDMKGNLLLPVIACEALLRSTGGLPVNVKFLYEGEEEIGSPSLGPFIAGHKELLACDMAVSADSGQFSEEQPALLVGLRGICGIQIDVRSAATDLHSGLMGGIAPNAVHALVRLLGSMHADDGRILVAGFYDDVLPLSPAEREVIARIPDDTPAALRRAGIKAAAGEPGYTPRERSWVRPTLEVNGIWGGFQGEGVKTIIPAEAHAKITCRLVPGQRSERVLALLRAHVEHFCPPEVSVAVTSVPGQAEPYLVPADHPGMAAAERTLTAIYGRAPLRLRMGASVPVTALFLELMGIYTVPFGFSLLDERSHAPDEFFRLAAFEKGQRAFCLLLEELGRQPGV